MKKICLGLIALLALSACEEINYTDQKLIAKLKHNGKTYDVYEAIQVDQSGYFVNGSAVKTEEAVYRLFPEGADAQLDATTTGVMFGANREIATCKANLEECRVRFLAKLDELNKNAGIPAPTERMGGGY